MITARSLLSVLPEFPTDPTWALSLSLRSSTPSTMAACRSGVNPSQ
jgi:hypothetical protein